MVKEWLSAVAITLTLLAFLPYIRAIRHGAVRPHVFSWVIWSITTFLVFLAQLADKGGAGAWPTGLLAGVTVFLALLAWRKRADITISGADRVFFAAALSALLFWTLTADPLWAVVVLTTVDVLGFGPTLRKAWHQPHSESLLFFGLFTASILIAIAALENYTLTTVLFPAVIAAACSVLMATVAYRRRSAGA